MKHFFLALLSISSCSALAQPTFIRTYSPIPYAWGVAATPSGGLVLTGNYSDTACYLLRLDRNGNVSWLKRYTGLGNPGGGSDLYPCPLNKFYAVTAAADGKLVVVGTANGMLSAQCSVSCYDSLGTWLWGQTSGVETHNESLSLAAVGNDQTVIVAGNSPDLTGSRATLFRYAVDDGTFLGGVRMLGAMGTQAIGIDLSPDGNVLMTTGQFGNQVMKLTPGLAPIWRLSWVDFSPALIRGQANGRTVLAGGTVMAAINPWGTCAWMNELVVDGEVQDIAVRPDGRILALGKNGMDHSWLMELDSTGALQWIKRYGNDGEGIALTNIELLPDSSAFLTGYDPVLDVLCVVSIDENGEVGNCPFPALSASVVPFAAVPADTLPTFSWSPGSAGVLQEIDSTVTIAGQIACGSVGYGTAESPAFLDLAVIPNPLTDHAVLVMPKPIGTDTRIELLDARGRSLRIMNGNGTREILIERGPLESGMYVLRVTGDGRNIGSARIIVD